MHHHAGPAPRTSIAVQTCHVLAPSAQTATDLPTIMPCTGRRGACLPYYSTHSSCCYAHLQWEHMHRPGHNTPVVSQPPLRDHCISPPPSGMVARVWARQRSWRKCSALSRRGTLRQTSSALYLPSAATPSPRGRRVASWQPQTMPSYVGQLAGAISVPHVAAAAPLLPSGGRHVLFCSPLTCLMNPFACVV